METNPVKEGWTEDLIKEYREQSLPTLYEFAVSGEKLSAEIRKQNKEIKTLRETIENLVTLASKPKEEVKPRELITKSTCQEALMEAFDAIFLLRDQADKSVKKLPRTQVLKKEKFRKKQIEKVERVDAVLGSFLEGVHLVEQKLLTLLADLDLEPFCPESGDLFSPREHRAVLKRKEGPPGTIHKTVRIGYRAKQEIVRFADVIVNY